MNEHIVEVIWERGDENFLVIITAENTLFVLMEDWKFPHPHRQIRFQYPTPMRVRRIRRNY